MAKLTVLQLVQRVLSAIDSEEVSSISDDIESEQVMMILQSRFEEIVNEFPWYTKTEDNLEVTAVANEMKIPDVDYHIDWLRYNKKNMTYLTPLQFRTKLDSRETTDDNVDALGAYDDRDPVYFTIENNETVVFDGYDGNLVASLSICGVTTVPTTPSTDTDIPDLPDILMTALFYAMKEDAFRELKGDRSAADSYQRKYIGTMSKAKRWAKKNNLFDKVIGVSYGRRGTKRVNSTIVGISQGTP